MALLSVKNLGISFGGLRAVNEFELDIGENELVGLIGPNGSGKTTVFNLLTGVYLPTDGSIVLDEVSIVGKNACEINRAGIARTFQNIRLFKDISVLDNIKIALHNQMSYSPFSSILRLPSYWKEEREATRRAMELLSVFGLEGVASKKAKSLSYGMQRKLEIARALATNPKLLLLDEPAAGMNPSETTELMTTIKLIREKFSISILLIEHDMKLVMGICERLVVLNYGMIIAAGRPEEIRNNQTVIAAYLGDQD